MKKGFTLIETVVALAVIVIISVAFFSMATFVGANLDKSTIKSFGALEMQSVSRVFAAADFEEAGQFSVVDLQKNLEFCGYFLMPEEEAYTFSKQIDGNGQENPKGKGIYQFWVTKNNEAITLWGKIFYKNQVIYEMPAFERVVSL